MSQIVKISSSGLRFTMSRGDDLQIAQPKEIDLSEEALSLAQVVWGDFSSRIALCSGSTFKPGLRLINKLRLGAVDTNLGEQLNSSSQIVAPFDCRGTINIADLKDLLSDHGFKFTYENNRLVVSQNGEKVNFKKLQYAVVACLDLSAIRRTHIEMFSHQALGNFDSTQVAAYLNSVLQNPSLGLANPEESLSRTIQLSSVTINGVNATPLDFSYLDWNQRQNISFYITYQTRERGQQKGLLLVATTPVDDCGLVTFNRIYCDQQMARIDQIPVFSLEPASFVNLKVEFDVKTSPLGNYVMLDVADIFNLRSDNGQALPLACKLAELIASGDSEIGVKLSDQTIREALSLMCFVDSEDVVIKPDAFGSKLVWILPDHYVGSLFVDFIIKSPASDLCTFAQMLDLVKSLNTNY